MSHVAFFLAIWLVASVVATAVAGVALRRGWVRIIDGERMRRRYECVDPDCPCGGAGRALTSSVTLLPNQPSHAAFEQERRRRGGAA